MGYAGNGVASLFGKEMRNRCLDRRMLSSPVFFCAGQDEKRVPIEYLCNINDLDLHQTGTVFLYGKQNITGDKEVKKCERR